MEGSATSENSRGVDWPLAVAIVGGAAAVYAVVGVAIYLLLVTIV